MRGIIALFLLLFSLSAQGQFIIDSYRLGGAAGLLLDDYPTAAAAYSLRLLRTAYTGDAITVRRSSNNDTLAIGFSGGVLDTAALKTFCGTGATDTCFVRRLYDQSSNARDFVQTTSANQPRILTSGVINREAGTPAMVFDGTNDWMNVPFSTAMFNFMHDGGDATIFSVQRFGSISDPNAAYVLYDNHGTSSSTLIGNSFFYDDRVSVPRSNTHVAQIGVSIALIAEENQITPNVIGLVYNKLDADNATAANRIRGAFNGGSDYGGNTLTAAPSASNAAFNFTLGSTAASTKVLFLLGAVQELIIYNADQSSNRTAIETNINNFYSIY
jgi:hypothetical protein